ncbi:hypothetical protein O181_105673 [Austropuccinia psidii MF-1]|uniref:Peptidase A2 domain-containing protein n=1 Tax=Austropuccinia psidii MF-1 TaxID=1389203 RepID=A0A9Q3JMI2_9BASI|nr:hypothetical protein [Austropuccinia psidii MF-1]
MQVFVLKEEYPVMALVDTGSELKIITQDSERKDSLPKRNLKMILRGIGEHTTSLIGLVEFTKVLFPSGEENEIHSFIAKGAVHTVLGRPFLAENNIRSEFPQKQGETFSYLEAEGRRSCVSICQTHMLWWKTGPPRVMELCSMTKKEDFLIKVRLKEAEDKSKAKIKSILKSTKKRLSRDKVYYIQFR